MSQLFVNIIIWVILPFIHFLIWRFKAQHINTMHTCPPIVIRSIQTTEILPSTVSKPVQSCPTGSFQCAQFSRNQYPSLELYNAKEFDQIYRAEKLAEVPYTEKKKNTMILHRDQDESCTKYITHTSGTIESKFCFAVVYYTNHPFHPPLNNWTWNLIRSDRMIDESGKPISTVAAITSKFTGPTLFLNEHNQGLKRPTGFFRKPPLEKGRERLKEKLGYFLINYSGIDGIQSTLHMKLSSHGKKVGDDMIVMVVNEGEIDLFLNFACSCYQHQISLDNLIVFAGSSEIVRVIEATGAIGMYHEGYGAVSKKASNDYLDRIFVDMMWYKAFSVYLVLQEGINVLFQDVDLVWFRDPFPFFHDYIELKKERSAMTGSHPEAFFSDDGQRTHRYTPYFANSGFYYLLSSHKSIYFAWSIMTAFDTVQVGGSHQNVFTMRLLEGLGVSYPEAKLLTTEEFPGGMMYHHNKKYMKQLLANEIHPYHFHMCWTQGKKDKLKYLRLASMWYLSDTCSDLKSLIPKGEVYGLIYLDPNRRGFDQTIAKTCCSTSLKTI